LVSLGTDPFISSPPTEWMDLDSVDSLMLHVPVLPLMGMALIGIALACIHLFQDEPSHAQIHHSSQSRHLHHR
jgi:hypothetical protein